MKRKESFKKQCVTSLAFQKCVNRRRSRHLAVRLSEEEWLKLHRFLNLNNTNASAFLRKNITEAVENLKSDEVSA